jgi:hypothetical protein
MGLVGFDTFSHKLGINPPYVCQAGNSYISSYPNTGKRPPGGYLLTRSLAALEICGQGVVLRSKRVDRIEAKISWSVFPQNGGIPLSSTYRITPADQTSTSIPYAFPCKAKSLSTLTCSQYLELLHERDTRLQNLSSRTNGLQLEPSIGCVVEGQSEAYPESALCASTDAKDISEKWKGAYRQHFRCHVVTAPYQPGYLLSRLDESRRSKVHSTKGVPIRTLFATLQVLKKIIHYAARR